MYLPQHKIDISNDGQHKECTEGADHPSCLLGQTLTDPNAGDVVIIDAPPDNGCGDPGQCSESQDEDGEEKGVDVVECPGSDPLEVEIGLGQGVLE